MVRFRCGSCGTVYEQDEFMGLPDKEIEGVGTGREKVCLACQSGMHTDQWRIRDAVGDTRIEISTVSELAALDLAENMWFSTAVVGDNDIAIVREYRTQEEAEEGHQEVLRRAESGELPELDQLMWASR